MSKNVETALIEQLIEESKYFCGKNCLIDSLLRMDDPTMEICEYCFFVENKGIRAFCPNKVGDTLFNNKRVIQ